MRRPFVALFVLGVAALAFGALAAGQNLEDLFGPQACSRCCCMDACGSKMAAGDCDDGCAVVMPAMSFLRHVMSVARADEVNAHTNTWCANACLTKNAKAHGVKVEAKAPPGLCKGKEHDGH